MSFYTEIFRNLNSMSIQDQISFFATKESFTCFNEMLWVQFEHSETAKGSISDKYVWKCQTKTCLKYKSTISIRDGSILSGFKLPLSDCIDLIYRFANEKQHKDTLDDLELCIRSIHTFYKKLRMLCHEYMTNNPVLLGGG
ncbi:hypothetical protein DMUE_5419 [Dictyocoela muelleri]|nr:hypothetical protein DMUE_5419 [Dictyocoela muelleri]